ncbi:helix-turn-helix domain-containing protein [Devosia rhizoryzae]|uniref:Helix-turn-helix transcriptional regulator n=1 Tax=Devosia rhizoryzae TaxID=2774137 RepID=A0ABX7C264_9HYPH|nr:helix-turn-helix transcriptional regulator [Devosia rhizoryzae]QQR38330.1 helix-turn-helix transcriptional regulator [Devosia rhizoryzae]
MTINITDRSPASDRDRREQLGISVDDLAARAGISVDELTAYEHAKSESDGNPTIAMKVADALDRFERDIDPTKDDPQAHPT